jgi:lipopolysaccharide export system protein LptA
MRMHNLIPFALTAALASPVMVVVPASAQMQISPQSPTRAATAPVTQPDVKPAAKPGAKPGDKPGALGNLGGNSKDPIKIDADRLDVFDREKRAVFQGNVVAVQGETTIRCTIMTVYYEQGATGGSPAARQPTPQPAASGADSAVKKVDCVGPVTVVAKDQVATGDNAVFDRVANIVTLTGNAAISQGPNVTRGDKVIYNVNTGIANVEGGRVRALFVPGSDGQAGGDKPAGATAAGPKKPPKPATN